MAGTGQQRARASFEETFDEIAKSESRLRLIIDALPALTWYSLPDGSHEFHNQRWCDFTGLSAGESLGSGWSGAIHPEDAAALMATRAEILNSDHGGAVEGRLRRADGVYRWFLFHVEPLRDVTGNILRWVGTATDIEDRKRSEYLLSAEKRTLEMIANGASLADILDNLCSAIDAQAPDAMSSIQLLDPESQLLWPVAGPKIPAGWTELIRPLAIGPSVGSCGTAAFHKKRVIVSDIASDPLWDGYQDFAFNYGLRACWSQPLVSKSNQVLGTFAMYYAEPRSPSPADMQLIQGAGNVAVIAIEGERSQAALTKALDEVQRSEAQLRTIIDAIHQPISILGPDGSPVYVNQDVLDYTGLKPKETRGWDFFARVFPPEDLNRVLEERQTAFARGVPFEMEQRVRGAGGTFRWFLIRFNPIRDEQGGVVRWCETGIDIEERKIAEERVRRENVSLREEIDRSLLFEEIVGSSDALRRVLANVAKVAPGDSTVLILGETGTGKELIARAIHKQSSRSTRAFIRVNCAAIPSALIASDLFGHEKGAFTGATERRIGRFEMADGGTLFLDEIGELPAETQIALLRVLQEREFERVGSSQPISVDVRVLAATNRDIDAAVAAGSFRLDLFYRLNVFPIVVPSLRERGDDIPVLVEYLIERYARKAGKRIRHITKKTLELFRAYRWPGNVRELQNVVERAVVLCDGETFAIDETWLKPEPGAISVRNAPLVTTLLEHEREMIETALAECRGRVSGPKGAAARLGLPRQTLESRIASLGINKHLFKTH